jgi:integrase
LDGGRSENRARAPTTPQLAAFIALGLDTGARKSELAALGWTDINLDAGVVTFWQQLDQAGAVPVYGPLKTKGRRSVDLMPATIAKLRTHKRAQAEFKMRHRTVYQDHGLVFAREPGDLRTPWSQLGQPTKELSEAPFQQLVKAAQVRRIRFHGLRHTSATLLIEAGVPVTVVSARLGHSKASMTLDRYAHVLPTSGGDAVKKLAAMLA